MTVNLGKMQAKPLTNNFVETANFLKQNKVTVNEVVQTHFTVEGVQSYNPQQIKVLKEKQERQLQNKQGTYIQTKAYQISDELSDQFLEETSDGKAKNYIPLGMKKNEVKEAVKEHKEAVKTKPNPKKQLENNNKVVTRLQKQRQKKSALEKRLEKLSKHYKEYFKSGEGNANVESKGSADSQQQQSQNSLCESIMSISRNQCKQSHLSSEEEEAGEEFQQISASDIQRFPAESFKKEKVSVKTKSTKAPVSRGKKPAKESQDCSFEEVDWEEEGVNMVGHLVSNKSCYSEKLGSAIHCLFN